MNTPSAPENIITIEPNDARRLANLCGQLDEHLRQIEKRLGVEIHNRGNIFALHGTSLATETASNILQTLYKETANTPTLDPEQVHLALQQANREQSIEKTAKATPAKTDQFSVIRTKKGNIKPRGDNQQDYVRAIQTHDINFGVGPAGTGKTYLAVACAVEAFLRNEIERILLVRPAVEAGEKLGFLPGDLSQKVDPYLRPLYDALFEMLGVETVGKLIDRNIIEVAPLAYMRGRTLNNAFIILDESQNTTKEQMKMFLTRIGFGSTAVITGDTTQIDLPRGTQSGLVQVCDVLKKVEGISFTFFKPKDVVRHSLVQSIVEAYDSYENSHASD